MNNGIDSDENKLEECIITDDYGCNPDGYIRPKRILKTLFTIFKITKLYKKIPPSTPFYRSRQGDLKCETELYPPPIEFTKSQRMSREGDSVFYCAQTEIDACEECLRAYGNKDAIIRTAEFISNQELIVLDLYEIPPVPSIFSESMGIFLDECLFLSEFQKDICKPVDRCTDSTQYVPTQKLTEFIRTNGSITPYGRVDGIAYRISVTNGKCYVFFFSNSDFMKTENRPFSFVQFLL